MATKKKRDARKIEVRDDGTTTLERFTARVIHRSEIKNADYNPRVIKEENRKRLKAGLAKLGLLGPITWNGPTGNIVGGHQRVKVMDTLNGTSDYRLTVAAVDLSVSEEKEANLLLNNQAAQGDWQMDALAQLLREAESDSEDAIQDLDATAFSAADIYNMFGAGAAMDMGGVLEDLNKELVEVSEAHEKVYGNTTDRDQDDFYVVFVASNMAAITKFLEDAGFDPTLRYHDVRQLREKLGLPEDAS